MLAQNNSYLQLSSILDSLSQLDGDLLAVYGLDRQFDITIVGSGAMILLGVLSPERRTTGIDVLEAPREVLSCLEQYDMNTAVETFLYSCPKNWQDRRQKLRFKGDVLSVYTMSLEDLTVLKLLAFRERDKDDLKDVIKTSKLDWERLASLIDDPTELRINLPSENDWATFVERYDWLLREKKAYE